MLRILLILTAIYGVYTTSKFLFTKNNGFRYLFREYFGNGSDYKDNLLNYSRQKWNWVEKTDKSKSSQKKTA